MNTRNITRPKFTPALPMILCGMALSAISLHADNGTWSNVTTSGDWNTAANWNGGTIAGGVDAVATLQAPLPAALLNINLDVDVTLGGITFESPGASTATGWTIGSTGGHTLTLATSTANAPILNVRGTQTISAQILGTQGFRKTSGGKLTLSGNNLYTGVTTLSDGNMTITSDNALGATGAGNGTVVSQVSGQYPQLHFSNNVTTSEDITLSMNWYTTTAGSTVGGNLIYNDSGTTTLNGTLTLNREAGSNANIIHVMGLQSGTGTLNINGAVSGSATGGQASGAYVDPTRLQFRTTTTSANINVSGAISDGTLTTGGLSVYTAADSSGIVRLSGANTYTGSTVHQKGTLLINNTTGSGTGAGAVSIKAGAILGGTGIIAPSGSNSVVIESNAIVAPGNLNASGAITGAGEKLTFNLRDTSGNATFQSGAQINLDATSAGLIDSLAFTGLTESQATIFFNDNTVNLSVTGGILADGLYTLVTFDANNAYSGNLVLGNGFDGLAASLIHNANSIQLQIGAIPEPATIGMMLGLSTLAVVAIRRRRRNR